MDAEVDAEADEEDREGDGDHVQMADREGGYAGSQDEAEEERRDRREHEPSGSKRQKEEERDDDEGTDPGPRDLRPEQRHLVEVEDDVAGHPDAVGTELGTRDGREPQSVNDVAQAEDRRPRRGHRSVVEGGLHADHATARVSFPLAPVKDRRPVERIRVVGRILEARPHRLLEPPEDRSELEGLDPVAPKRLDRDPGLIPADRAGSRPRPVRPGAAAAGPAGPRARRARDVQIEESVSLEEGIRGDGDAGEVLGLLRQPRGEARGRVAGAFGGRSLDHDHDVLVQGRERIEEAGVPDPEGQILGKERLGLGADAELRDGIEEGRREEQDRGEPDGPAGAGAGPDPDREAAAQPGFEPVCVAFAHRAAYPVRPPGSPPPALRDTPPEPVAGPRVRTTTENPPGRARVAANRPQRAGARVSVRDPFRLEMGRNRPGFPKMSKRLAQNSRRGDAIARGWIALGGTNPGRFASREGCYSAARPSVPTPPPMTNPDPDAFEDGSPTRARRRSVRACTRPLDPSRRPGFPAPRRAGRNSRGSWTDMRMKIATRTHWKPLALATLVVLATQATLAQNVAAIDPANEAAPAAAPAANAANAEASSPAAMIETFHAGLLQIMKEAKTLGFEGRIERLAPLMGDTFDLDFMASKTVGRHWKKLSEEEKGEWAETFARFTTANYAGRFTGFTGEEFVTLGVEDAARGTRNVLTKIVVPDGDDVLLNYRVIERDGEWKVIDVYLNGTVSELALRRSEYSSALKREGFDSLMASIENKIEDLKEKGKAEG